MKPAARPRLGRGEERVCTKHAYSDQAPARVALAHLRMKSKPGAKAPIRVYPCDVCDGWHLTSKRLSGKTPPWDLAPNWSRPMPRTGDPS